MTTIVSVRRNNQVVLGGDGQVSLGNTILKGNAKKIHRLYGGKVLAGFAGSTADAFSLLEIFEDIIKNSNGQLEKAAVSFAKHWRTDKALRKLEAMLIVVDKNKSFIISGSGDVVQQDDDILAIGSGGHYAYAAAKALLQNTDYDAKTIVEKSLEIAGDICVFTNHSTTIESIITN